MADKIIDFRYANKKALKYLKFIAMWTIMCGIPFSIIERKFLFGTIFIGAINGNNVLYHFWFLIGLIAIYYLKAICNKLSIKVDLSKHMMVIAIIIALTIMFGVNLYLKKVIGHEIRELIPPYARFVTNGSYFLVGCSIKKSDKERSVPLWCYLAGVVLSILGVAVCSDLIDNMWASTMYCSIPVFIGTICLFYLIILFFKNVTWSEVNTAILSTSVGIWVLHPFVLRVINKLYRVVFGNIDLLGKILILVITVLISCICTLFLKKNKILSWILSI